MPDIHIKKPYFSAYKFFRWKDKVWGYGISTEKIEKLKRDGKEFITVQLEGSDVYEVELAKLEACIVKKNSYNQNGKAYCGYVTKSDILRLARLLKSAREPVEDTNIAEG